MAEMTAMREIKAEDAVMRFEQGGVHGEITGRTGEGLNVDAPTIRGRSKGFESALLTKTLRHVDELVAAVVARAGVALGVLVGHDRADGVEDGAGGEVLGRDELDGLDLAGLLPLYDVEHVGVDMVQRGVERGGGGRGRGGDGGCGETAAEIAGEGCAKHDDARGWRRRRRWRRWGGCCGGEAGRF